MGTAISEGKPPTEEKNPSWLSVVMAIFSAVLTIFPQDASGDLALTPVTSKLCNWCTAVCIVMAVWAHCFYEYSDTRPAVGDEDPWMQRTLQLTATLALVGLVFETCLAVAIKLMGLETMYQEDLTFRRRLRLNRKMLVAFSCLTTFYHLMAFDIQYVHKGWLAERHGGHQIVYSVRYMEWTVCAPIVLSMSGQLEHAPDGTPRNGIIPSALLTGIYCIISWQGLVVKDLFAGWALIAFAFVCYFAASVEQLAFAWYIKDKGCAGPLRAGLLTYLVIMMGLYGVMYLLPIPGWISATLENKFYCYGDASFKLGTSIMLLTSNDLANNDEMRRRAEATAEDLQRLVDTASVPIFGVDRDCRIVQWNGRAAELTGLPEEKALGRPLLPMLGNASRPEGEAMIRSALEGQETGTLETSLELEPTEGNTGDDGSHARQALLMLSVTPRRDKTGAVTGATLIGCDLTEVQAYKEAECRKNRFLGVVSHELRSPLHGILGLMDRLIDDEEDTTKGSLYKMVQNCAARLLELVVNIMEMASMAQKDQRNKPQTPKALAHDPVGIPKIIEEIITLIRSSRDKRGNPLVKRNVRLINEVGALPIIEADAHKCTQVFYNIITNACKFTEKGQIVVSSSKDAQGGWVEVSVADTGKGIAREALDRIFRPFEQEDTSESRSRHYEGIGLGLAIAQEVVRRHGGRIAVQSEVGVGTTFTVRLPVTAPGNSASPQALFKGAPEEGEAEKERGTVEEAGPAEAGADAGSSAGAGGRARQDGAAEGAAPAGARAEAVGGARAAGQAGQEPEAEPQATAKAEPQAAAQAAGVPGAGGEGPGTTRQATTEELQASLQAARAKIERLRGQAARAGTAATAALPPGGPASAEPPAPQELRHSPKPARERQLLLSVDANEVNQAVITGYLSAEYEIHTVSGGEEALEYLRNPPEGIPDLILLDMLPGMSGFAVCRHVRREMKLPPTSLPILMLSACESSFVVDEGLESGCNSVVPMPVDKLVLGALVKSALKFKCLHEEEVAAALTSQTTHAPARAGWPTGLKGAKEEQAPCDTAAA